MLCRQQGFTLLEVVLTSAVLAIIFAVGILSYSGFNRTIDIKIGRASWRGRGEISVVAGSFKKRRGHRRWNCDWSSDVCSSDLAYVSGACNYFCRRHTFV